MDITFLQNSLEETENNYRSSKTNLLWLEQYHSENQNYRDYEGREILELLQNADDARSSHADIRLDTAAHTLSIKNHGLHTLVFTKEGMRSVMASNLSPKKNDRDAAANSFIGSKGLGFKSILNWTSEICIMSDNVVVRFGEDMVTRFWEELKVNIADPETYEEMARRDGHNVPLPVLRLPEISELKSPLPMATIIELTLSSDEVVEKVRDALDGFSPESLLFLHNLRHVRIDINGERREFSMVSERIDAHLDRCRIGDDCWLVSRRNGRTGDANFEVAAAFNLNDDRREDSYNLFTFFPTDEVFPYPCILHATLQLNASRKAILTGQSVNYSMMDLLADRIMDLARYLKTTVHGWQPYSLVHPGFNEENYSAFVKELKHCLDRKSKGGEFVPVLFGEGYSDVDSSYYYDDAFFAFVRDRGGAGFFPGMMLSGRPDSMRCRHDMNAAAHIEGFAAGLGLAELAQFISILCDWHSGVSGICTLPKWNLHLLRDEHDCVITGTAYLNSGRKIADIPGFLDIKYVDDSLKDHLLAQFHEQGKGLEGLRAVARRLSETVVNVSQSDVSGIKQMLMLSRADASRYTHGQIDSILVCLYRLYLSSPGEFRAARTECFLPAEDGRLRPAGDLIFGDPEFPDGIRRLGLKTPLYQPGECAHFPYCLAALPEGSGKSIQDFYTELGVNRYFKTKEVCYGDDRGYLKLNGISDENAVNASSHRVPKGRNTCNVPAGIEKWDVLDLTDLVRLIKASGLTHEILANIGLEWFYNRLFGPEPLGINYISYLLTKGTQAKRLANYVVSTGEWITDPDKGFTYDKDDDLLSPALVRLGAKLSYADFTPTELYSLIEARAADFEKTGNASGIPEFYHKVKMAFVSKGDSAGLPPDRVLPMVCRLDGRYLVMDSRRIFYSNNWTSAKLESALPILLLQLRDGEDQVNRHFGCRRVKDLAVRVIDREANALLAHELTLHLDRLKPWILALTCKDSADPSSYISEKKGLLGRLAVTVVRRASYCFEYDGRSTGIENMKEGDMFMVDRAPLVCCRSASLADALDDPRFCNSIAGALCVVLNLSSKENTDRFYRIVKASPRELAFMADNTDPALWQGCQEAFGISDAEIDFWRRVFERNGKGAFFSPEKLKEGKSRYVAGSLGITPDRADRDKFGTFHLQQLLKTRDGYVGAYMAWLHACSKDSFERQRRYLGKINEFQSDAWVKEAFSQWEGRFDISPDYRSLVADRMEKLFDFDPGRPDGSPVSIPARLDMYDCGGLELNIEDESLLYFEGNGEYFARLRDKYAGEATASPAPGSCASPGKEPEETHIEISVVDTVRPHENSGGEGYRGNKRGRGKTGRKPSDQKLKEIGNRAEDTVLKQLTSPGSEYEIGSLYSRHLNPETGNDAQGYDLSYRRKGEEIYRYLEIKHCTGNRIIVSRHEYEVARSEECRGLYDVALVDGGKIRIWRNAFADESKYSISADDYTIAFDISTD